MLKEWEQLQTAYGDNWVWIAFDPVHKLVLAACTCVLGTGAHRRA